MGLAVGSIAPTGNLYLSALSLYVHAEHHSLTRQLVFCLLLWLDVASIFFT